MGSSSVFAGKITEINFEKRRSLRAASTSIFMAYFFPHIKAKLPLRALYKAGELYMQTRYRDLDKDAAYHVSAIANRSEMIFDEQAMKDLFTEFLIRACSKSYK